MKLPIKLRLGITAIFTFLVWGHIIWDYFHGGIPIHYLLHDDNLPGIPNWLGGIFLPFFSWFLLYRIHKRIDLSEKPEASESLKLVSLRLFLAMLLSILIAVFFTYEIDVIGQIMLGIFILAFIFPLYKSEFLLGWVVGSSFTFGAIIPISFGSVFALICFVFYKIARLLKGMFVKKTD